MDKWSTYESHPANSLRVLAETGGKKTYILDSEPTVVQLEILWRRNDLTDGYFLAHLFDAVGS